MAQKSYARVYMQGGKIGLHLVNAKQRDFILYAKPLLSMVKNPGQYARVKHRNGPGKPAIGYHPGEVWGILDPIGPDQMKLSIVLGAGGQDLVLNSVSKKPDNALCTYAFILPASDFNVFYRAIALMEQQRLDFQDLLDGADTAIMPD